jgi:hypothetical protein
LVASSGDHAKVAEIFRQAMRGEARDVEAFRRYLVNWLADKVVDPWPPLPDELKEPLEASADLCEGEATRSVRSSTTAEEEWLPASKAVEWAQQRGYSITLTWLTRDAAKHGVLIRPRELAGRHKREVERNSLAGYLLEREKNDSASDPEASQRRLSEAREQRRKERPLD